MFLIGAYDSLHKDSVEGDCLYDGVLGKYAIKYSKSNNCKFFINISYIDLLSLL